jgi:uncharacterized protein YbjT (DUF2867 family)
LASVFVTGGTGYIGRPTLAALAARDHRVRALVRPGAASRLPPHVEAVIGDALDGATFASWVEPGDTLVQLVGTPKPSPAKAAEFERVDLVSVRESVRVAVERGVRHFVYLSVAQPAPVMRAYVSVRERGEAMLRASGVAYTALRPWYVLGPGHWWPYALVPFYRLAELLPSTRDTARRLGLVTLGQMVSAIVGAVEDPPRFGSRVVEVTDLRRSAL